MKKVGTWGTYSDTLQGTSNNITRRESITRKGIILYLFDCICILPISAHETPYNDNMLLVTFLRFQFSLYIYSLTMAFTGKFV